jgi:lactoylglutathione lyase
MTSTHRPLEIVGVAHLGIRVADFERSRRFYEQLGFRHVAGPFEHEPVVILENDAGVEINLIVNATPSSSGNVLMDVAEKHAGYTHVALLVPSLEETLARLQALGIEPSSGPVTFPNGSRAVFLRDPDRSVIELHERAPA